MSRNAQAFSVSLLANNGKFKEAAQAIAEASSPVDAALMLAQVYREVDINTANAVEAELKKVAA